ncbi:hypothetical protein ACFTZJ_00930 [Streptomyces globisporus]
MTDADDIAQLRHLFEGEVAVAVPRELITDLDEFEGCTSRPELIEAV